MASVVGKYALKQSKGKIPYHKIMFLLSKLLGKKLDPQGLSYRWRNKVWIHKEVRVLIEGDVMIFSATDWQIKQLAANVANAAVPSYVSFMGYSPGDIDLIGSIPWLDCYKGQKAKVDLKRIGREQWQLSGTPDSSWVDTYPTFSHLLESVGITNELIK